MTTPFNRALAALCIREAEEVLTVCRMPREAQRLTEAANELLRETPCTTTESDAER
jgi:hypothetical protein